MLATIGGGISLLFLAGASVDPSIRIAARETFADEVYVPLVQECVRPKSDYRLKSVFDLKFAMEDTRTGARVRVTPRHVGAESLDYARRLYIDHFARKAEPRAVFSSEIQILKENDFDGEVVAYSQRGDVFTFIDAVIRECTDNGEKNGKLSLMARGIYHPKP